LVNICLILGKNKAIAPYEKHFLRYFEQMENPIILERMIQQGRSLAKNNTTSLYSKKLFMKRYLDLNTKFLKIKKEFTGTTLTEIPIVPKYGKRSSIIFIKISSTSNEIPKKSTC
jgi:hypothetical protein